MTIDIIEIIQAGIENFQGADWRHVYTRKGSTYCEEILYCEGEMKKCSVCAKARKDARRARTLAEQAIEALSEGNLAEAHRLIEQAYYIEFSWGDAPAYRPAATALAAAILATK